jgi:hypothetical protein
VTWNLGQYFPFPVSNNPFFPQFFNNLNSQLANGTTLNQNSELDYESILDLKPQLPETGIEIK